MKMIIDNSQLRGAELDVEAILDHFSETAEMAYIRNKITIVLALLRDINHDINNL